MKKILFMCVLAFGCSKKNAAGSSACADAVAKGVDTMMASGAKRMESMGGMPPDMKAKMDGAAVKLKAVITNRCTEDKWSAEVVDCYSKATTREDIRSCRAKLPPEQSQKLQGEEMQVMSAMMGGGGMGGMRMHPGDSPPPPAGSGATPAAEPPASGSGAK